MSLINLFKRPSFGRAVRDPAGVSLGLHAVIGAELQRLELYRRGMGTDAIEYVATGEPSILLDTIAAFSKITPVHRTPYALDFQARSDAERATNLALVRGEIAPGEHLARLMAVRHAVGGYHRAAGAATPTAAQIPALTLLAAIENGLGAAQVNYVTPWETIVPLPGLLDLVTAAGGTPRELFHYVLTSDRAQWMAPGSWPASDAFQAIARAHPAAYADAVLAVAPDRRGAAFKMAEHHDLHRLPEVIAALVVMLTKPFGKGDRELASSALARLDGPALQGVLERTWPNADIETRFGLAQAAGRNASPGLIAMLEKRLKSEKAAKVKATIQAVLEAADAGSSGSLEAPEFPVIDGSSVAIPPRNDLGTEQAMPASDDDRAAYLALVEAVAIERAELLAKKGSSGDLTHYHQPPTPEEIEANFLLLTEGKPLPNGVTWGLTSSLFSNRDFQSWYNDVLDRLPLAVALRSLLGRGYSELGKMLGYQHSHSDGCRWATGKMRGWVEAGRCDLRDVAAVDQMMREAHAVAWGREVTAFGPVELLRQEFSRHTGYFDRPVSYETPLKELPIEAVWPWLAENLHILDEALGLQPASTPMPMDRALALLELLPAVPQRYFARLLEIALTEKRTLRRRAMALLRPAKELAKRLEALLDDARQQVRINAATWLADIRAPGSETALRKRLEKEKSDLVRTELVEALQRLGADLSDLIGPASLIAEADKAAVKGAPELPEWLIGSGLPSLRFRDGANLPERVLRHWLTLAIRLKSPGATGQFGIYLDQLEPGDAEMLSKWVLDSWIAFDTHSASLEEANAHALANYAQDYRWRYPTRSQTPELRDKIIAELRRQKLGEMLNSGSDTKGLLALACRADPVWAANRVRWFLRKHGRRSNQAMALLDALAGIGAPAALQVVIAASARLKQKSTQAHAAAIAERYAEDRGWTFDELADRTVPTAGFDDDGVLDLPCGEEGKPYTARLDAALAIHLFNPDGKPVKALPAGDDEASRESQKAFSAAKRELKQVVELQSGRLIEAMCAERNWLVGDWRLAFYEHPVMRRLIERLVWQGLDEDGRPFALFRPTQEGDFTDAADMPFDINGFARLRLAHGALVDAGTGQAWIAHLKDYEVTPFLPQFDALRSPLADELADADAIADRQGWVAESLSYRGVADKRGYERVMGDGGGCQEYAKSFPAHGITAVIHHSGSNAVDENNRVALKQLTFARKRHGGALKLRDVPPVIRAECWADYHAVAAKGAFDPEWEKVCIW